MVTRHFWTRAIESAWNRRSVLWLSGVRRAGKTMLSQSLADVEYFDCELPRARRMLEDPESFLKSVQGKRIVLDEIHRLDHPSEILKIAADHYPNIRVLAAGSSTLGASKKFRDTLVGRKEELWLTPMITEDLKDFGRTDMHHRFLQGGLPPFFLAETFPEREFQEWIDAFWAKDIQELFRLERRHSFQKFAELLMAQSGGIFEATRFSRPCEVSRATVTNYLAVLEATYVVHVIRPFSTHRSTEIITAPKVYGFDTGVICHQRGWHELRSEDRGLLWEHFVLNETQAQLQTRDVRYWRDKRGHEVDFVLVRGRQPPLTIECKWSAADFDPAGLLAMRRAYPRGNNFVVASDVERGFARSFGEVSVDFVSLGDLIKKLKSQN
jgi:predicted AAA+ superfamily ATPase